MSSHYDIVIIGGGFYGCSLALHLKEKFRRILIIEKETDLLQRASLNNQARVHNGYHYPRSILTAFRSRQNFQRFVNQFDECINKDFDKYYAISRLNSKVTAEQFSIFCQRINAPIKKAPKEILELFNPNLIENVFAVKEFAFDAEKLKNRMTQELIDNDIDVWLSSECLNFSSDVKNKLNVNISRNKNDETITTRYLFNCTYSSINSINQHSNIEKIPLKHEFTEMALIKMPEEYSNFSITVMCGPFFSIMPYPSRGLHTLSHVRYTPHNYWYDGENKNYINSNDYMSNVKSKFQHMYKDAIRYLPMVEKSKYIESLYEIKTVLPQSEIDDSRPILFKADDNFTNYVSIMGGKIDNIYDIQEEVDDYFRLYGGMT